MKHSTMAKMPLNLSQNLTLPNSVPLPPPTREQVIEVNFRYTTLIAMCLGFLFIWSTVVSAMFMKKSYEDRVMFQKPLMVFEDQERLGRLMFSIGQEMRKFHILFSLSHPFSSTQFSIL